ncbi:hypothetical protein BDF20DRAFT_891190 [Mycotypha africana]|uniref:uncharacterized protein n=1 Tax=Mycotypha africana TaxID=64632 RepID=UPI0023000FE4|nr:uncharacterized protein BDF20DRAFT_891190 [Mycotypha africana]KAI8970419.1 hypothetical protein BDF20DRAFT_891190 [Mycotypha africana]
MNTHKTRIPSLNFKADNEEELSSSRETSDMEIDSDYSPPAEFTDSIRRSAVPRMSAYQNMASRSFEKEEEIVNRYSNLLSHSNVQVKETNNVIEEELEEKEDDKEIQWPFHLYQPADDVVLNQYYPDNASSIDFVPKMEIQDSNRIKGGFINSNHYSEAAYSRDALARLIATDCEELCQDIVDHYQMLQL